MSDCESKMRTPKTGDFRLGGAISGNENGPWPTVWAVRGRRGHLVAVDAVVRVQADLPPYRRSDDRGRGPAASHLRAWKTISAKTTPCELSMRSSRSLICMHWLRRCRAGSDRTAFVFVSPSGLAKAPHPRLSQPHSVESALGARSAAQPVTDVAHRQTGARLQDAVGYREDPLHQFDEKLSHTRLTATKVGR